MGEKPIFEMDELIEALAEGLEPLLDRPFLLFGHSLGGYVAFELARDLRNHGLNPLELFIAGTPAPHLPRTAPNIHDRPDDELLSYLRALGGTPKAIMEQPWLVQLALPNLRADMTMLETYIHARHAPLTCPITALWGTEDDRVPEERIHPWTEHTLGTCTFQDFAGGHFFLDAHREAIGRLIQDAADSRCKTAQTMGG
jgi:medium-chain acyl-[acyl-carrier-protein] hydrolase